MLRCLGHYYLRVYDYLGKSIFYYDYIDFILMNGIEYAKIRRANNTFKPTEHLVLQVVRLSVATGMLTGA
jgi:hypothetical protein